MTVEETDEDDSWDDGWQDDDDEDKVGVEVIVNSLQEIIKTVLNIVPLLTTELIWSWRKNI